MPNLVDSKSDRMTYGFTFKSSILNIFPEGLWIRVPFDAIILFHCEHFILSQFHFIFMIFFPLYPLYLTLFFPCSVPLIWTESRWISFVLWPKRLSGWIVNGTIWVDALKVYYAYGAVDPRVDRLYKNVLVLWIEPWNTHLFQYIEIPWDTIPKWHEHW